MKPANIRRATLEDLPQVLGLNQAALPSVSSLTLDKLRSLFDQSTWFHVAVVNGECVGFLNTLPPKATYGSENYLWFMQRFPNFLYIDRICIAPEFSRGGIGSRLYTKVETFARQAQIPMLTCEVNLEPANPVSLAFHDKHQFAEVDQQWIEGGTIKVSMRIKQLGEGSP